VKKTLKRRIRRPKKLRNQKKPCQGIKIKYVGKFSLISDFADIVLMNNNI
jgi:hypothetical protein